MNIKFKSKGKCIYCGDEKSPLTDEHIVPYFIGGKHIIEKASCNACADITKRFEQDVARDLWGDARNSYNAPTRRKKERAKKISIPAPNGVGEVLSVEPSVYPGLFYFYKMGFPGILTNTHENVDQSKKWEIIIIQDEERLKNYSKIFNRPATAYFKNVPESFAKLIAKIAYCNALSAVDQEDFIPLIVPYFMKSGANLSFLVGSHPELQEPNPCLGYSLRHGCVGSIEKMFLVEEVRLLANCHTPSYCVVVGYTTGLEKCQRLIDKLANGGSLEIGIVKSDNLTDGLCIN